MQLRRREYRGRWFPIRGGLQEGFEAGKTRAVFHRYNIVNARDLRDGVSRLAALHAALPEQRRETIGGH